MRSFCSGYPGSKILGHGHITLPAYREGLTYRVFSAEQGKSVSLPSWGSEAVRRIDGDADSGTEKKRMLPCNRADRGCVAFLGQHYFAGNGADFSVVLNLENVLQNRSMKQSK